MCSPLAEVQFHLLTISRAMRNHLKNLSCFKAPIKRVVLPPDSICMLSIEWHKATSVLIHVCLTTLFILHQEAKAKAFQTLCDQMFS